jgi:predicted permease
MRLWHSVLARLRSLLSYRRREADLREELQLHLDREAERLQATGMAADAARLQALRTFGAVERTKEECRDARGTALVDNVARDVRFTWRSLRRSPLAALTIVVTVGLGLGLVAVVFTVLNTLVFRADGVRNPHELFAIDRQRAATTDADTFTTRAGYDALLRETSVFSGAVATTPDVDAWMDGVRREGRLVTGNFFEVLGVDAARGRPLTPSDEAPGRPPVVVLSHRAWSQHYASDPGIVNRTIRVNGAWFQVVGVMPESFRGLEFAAPDYWAPLSLLDHFRPGTPDADVTAGLNVVGRLASGVSTGQALAQLTAWDSQRTIRRQGEPPAPRLVLEPKPGTVPLSMETLALFMPLFFAFGLILMIGCANVANLLLARGVARQREIGIRLAIGASRRRVVGQLLIESLLLALVAAALAFGLSRLVLGGVVHAIVATFPPGAGSLRLAVPEADWRVGLFLVAGAFASTLLFALAPALQATRVELVRAIRGEVVADARPGRLRSALVVLQVTGSVLLLVCAAIFLRSSWAAAKVEPGIRIAGVVTVNVLDETKRATALDVVRTEPSVTAIAAAWPSLLGGRPATADGSTGKATITYQFVSPEYFDLLGVELVRGRGFSAVEQSASAGVATVSEAVAGRLWPGRDAIGQSLRLESDATQDPREPGDPPAVARSVTVVGVTRDVAGFRLGGFRMGGAGVYIPIGLDAAKTSLILSTRGDAERVRTSLIDRMARFDPNMGEVETLRTFASMETYLLAIPFWLTLALGALALALTLSGLFSVLSYLVEQRTREIGVRMALGATRGDVASLVLSQLVRPIGLGLLLGGSLTAALGGVLLSTPAAEAIGETVRLFDPLAYVGSLLCIVAACACAGLVPALRAGRVDPVAAMRQS